MGVGFQWLIDTTGLELTLSALASDNVKNLQCKLFCAFPSHISSILLVSPVVPIHAFQISNPKMSLA
jgi:hypothetical protein